MVFSEHAGGETKTPIGPRDYGHGFRGSPITHGGWLLTPSNRQLPPPTDAARQLMGHAARQNTNGSTHPGSSIHGAAALSAASTALGPTLGSLFRAAANVGRRVRQETALHDSNIDLALQEMETLAADRIVEEELATWQAQEAEIQRATNEIPRVAQPRSSFEKPEPVSEVRLRVGTTIKPHISYLLEPKSAY